MRYIPKLIGIIFLLASYCIKAEVDKVYHPYVELDTYEFEARIIGLLDREGANEFSVYRFGFGKDISEQLFLEFYLIGAQESSHSFEIEAYELEALYQITEQGEYWADFGLLIEVEKEKESKEWEGNIGLIIEKELGQWSATVNFQNKYLYQDDLYHEWKASQAIQFRYRYSSQFEPGIEIYTESAANYIGVVTMGQIRSNHNKFNWELGFLRGAGNDKDENLIRAMLEYEF